MMSKKKILWLIVARSGSKSVPGKNIKMLGENPLISFKIKSALNTLLDKVVWVSTDSEVYANISRDYGAEIPFIRPNYLATDSASSSDVVLHAMHFANSKGLEFEYIGLLEPTSPFILSHQLETILEKLEID